MAFFADPQLIKLAALGCAFIVGVGVCFYVVIKETAELKQRRQAKRLLYTDEVQREVERKKYIMQKAQGSEPEAAQIDTQTNMQRSSNQSFALTCISICERHIAHTARLSRPYKVGSFLSTSRPKACKAAPPTSCCNC